MKRVGVLVGVVLVAFLGGTTHAAPASGPPLSEPPEVLSGALHCSPDVEGASRSPVLLVHGTGSGPDEFAWNWIPAFTAAHVPYCAVDLVDNALGDIQDSAERVVYAIRTMHEVSGQRVDIVGHSQGGMVPRWALRFWPDTRAMVDDVIGIAASNHGTVVADGYCALPCPPANWQQASTSKFITALNAGSETWAGVSYTSIYTHFDEVVFPNLDATGSTSLHTGEGAISNIAIQDVCPLAVNDHIGLGTYDPIAYAIAVDAMDHAGPAEPGRIAPTVCTQLVMPGVNPATFATDYGATIADLGQNLLSASTVGAEPPLRCYVTDTCAAARAEAPAPPPSGGSSPPSGGTATVRGATLAATGVDLDALAAGALVLLTLALLTRRTLAAT